jgi:hypothetical protein
MMMRSASRYATIPQRSHRPHHCQHTSGASFVTFLELGAAVHVVIKRAAGDGAVDVLMCPPVRHEVMLAPG